MSELRFEIVGCKMEPHSAVPTLSFDLRISTVSPASYDLALNTQVRIEPERRRYSEDETENLAEMFGHKVRWGDTLRPFAWAQVSQMIPSFEGEAIVPLSIPCTYDFEVAAAKYLHALSDGDVPLRFFFSGTIFGTGERGMQVTRIPWDREAVYRLPVKVWREMMDHYFPGSGWLRLRRETLDALLRFKAARALPTWDGVLEDLLRSAQRAS